ncbi:MAG: cytochrome ubiquinol oxidase subunit I [Peptococcaceae bacterium]
MDVVLLFRIQFALAAGFHFPFPPLTIGMARIIFIMQTLSWKSKAEVYEK